MIPTIFGVLSVLLLFGMPPQATTLLAERRYEEAANLCLRLLQASPKDPDILDVAGQAFMGLGRTREAIALFRREAAAAPMNLRATRSLAAAYVSVNALGEARELLGQLTSSDQDDPSNWFQLGLLLYRNGYYPAAIDDLDHALARENDGRLLPADRNLAKIARAISLVETGRNAEAVAVLPGLIGLAENRSNLDLRLSYARVLYEDGRLNDALTQTDRALDLNAANAAVHFWRARILRRQDDIRAATAEAERARDLAPASPAPRNLLVQLYRKLGRESDSEREAAWLRLHEAQ